MPEYKAILLIGPTGSGKTPLGNLCEQKGLGESKCIHFDFGESLRRITELDMKPSFLSEVDMHTIHNSLQSGSLLGDDNLHIARNILQSFVAERETDQDDILILNGFPRHSGQARYIDTFLDIETILYLQCTPEVAQKRIQLNAGGDRHGRSDDSLEDLGEKLAIFQKQTLPLLDHYRSRGIPVKQLQITENTTAEQMYRSLEETHPF